MLSDYRPSVERRWICYRSANRYDWGTVPDASSLVAWLNNPASFFGILRGLVNALEPQHDFVQQEIVAAKRIGILIDRLQELSRVAANPDAGEWPKDLRECHDAVKEITDQYRIAPGFVPYDEHIRVFDDWIGYFTSTEYLAVMAIWEMVNQKSLHTGSSGALTAG
jgi:hypothetical protein